METEKSAPELPGLGAFDPYHGEAGPVEAGTAEAVAQLRADGWIDARHSHLVALATSAARDFDRMPRTKAYGVAQMTTAIAKVFELLPQPEMQSSDALADLAAMLEANDEPAEDTSA